MFNIISQPSRKPGREPTVPLRPLPLSLIAYLKFYFEKAGNLRFPCDPSLNYFRHRREGLKN